MLPSLRTYYIPCTMLITKIDNTEPEALLWRLFTWNNAVNLPTTSKCLFFLDKKRFRESGRFLKITKLESSRAGPAKQTANQTSVYNPHSTSTRQVFSLSPRLQWGQVAEYVGTCPRTDTSEFWWGPLQSMPLSGAPGPQPRATPSSFQHRECLSQLRISCVLEMVVTGTRQVHRQGDGCQVHSQEWDKPERKWVWSRGRGGPVFPHSVQSSGIPENTQKSRERTSPFFCFGFLHPEVDENQLVELTDWRAKAQGSPLSLQQYPY